MANINLQQRRIRHAWALSALATIICVTATASASTPAEEYRFDVYYNDKRIGEHEFRINRDEREIRVQSSANFLVKLLFVPVYRYQHVAEERWLAGCLRSLAASTNDNGERFEVSLQPDQGQLLLSVLTPSTSTVPVTAPCPASYAYWDLNLLRRGELINSQTGDVLSAQLLDRGIEEINGIAARRFTLIAGDAGTIELWYRASDSQWIGLETVRNGGRLAYRAGA